MTSDEIWFGESGGGRGDGNKGPAVSEQHSSPGRDCRIFSNMIKYSNIQILSNIIKETAVSGQHSSPMRDCQKISETHAKTRPERQDKTTQSKDEYKGNDELVVILI